MKKVIAATLGFALTTGCTTLDPVRSVQLPDESSANVKGLVYSLPRTHIKLVLSVVKNQQTISLAETVSLPDSSARYVASFNQSQWADDDFSLGVDARGLLTTVKAHSTDQVGAVVTTIADGVSGIISRGGNESGNRAATAMVTGTFVIDPFAVHASGKGTADTSIPNVSFEVITGDKSLEKRLNNGTYKTAGRVCPTDADICVPLVTAIVLRVTAGGRTIDLPIVVADPNRVIGIDIDRHACVNTKTDLMLKQGLLASYAINKPSEVAACAKIPLKIIEAILAVPFNAITGRNASLAAEKSTLDAQKELLTSQLNLLKAERDLAAARAEAAEASQ